MSIDFFLTVFNATYCPKHLPHVKLQIIAKKFLAKAQFVNSSNQVTFPAETKHKNL